MTSSVSQTVSSPAARALHHSLANSSLGISPFGNLWRRPSLNLYGMGFPNRSMERRAPPYRPGDGATIRPPVFPSP